LSVTCATCALRRVLYEEGPVVKSGTSCLANELGSALYRLLDGEERVDGELRAGPIQAGSSGDQIAGRGLAGAKGRCRVSMDQMASVSLRATSTRATLGPRWRPSRCLVR
jgi:hypothetical protein